MPHLVNLLRERHSKSYVFALAQRICKGEYSIEDLIENMSSKDIEFRKHASWLLQHTYDICPRSFDRYASQLYTLLSQSQHDSEKRSLLRVFYDIPIDVKMEGALFDLCLGFVENHEEAIAVRAFSISVLCRIAKSYPDLNAEIQVLLRSYLDIDIPAIKSRAKSGLKYLQK